MACSFLGTEHNILFSLILADAICMASFLLSSPALLPLLKLLILEDVVYVFFSLNRVSIYHFPTGPPRGCIFPPLK